MPGSFVTFRDVAGRWRFRLKAANGRTVAAGQSYATKWNAKRGARAAQRAAADAQTIDPDDELARES